MEDSESARDKTVPTTETISIPSPSAADTHTSASNSNRRSSGSNIFSSVFNPHFDVYIDPKFSEYMNARRLSIADAPSPGGSRLSGSVGHLLGSELYKRTNPPISATTSSESETSRGKTNKGVADISVGQQTIADYAMLSKYVYDPDQFQLPVTQEGEWKPLPRLAKDVNDRLSPTWDTTLIDKSESGHELAYVGIPKDGINPHILGRYKDGKLVEVAVSFSGTQMNKAYPSQSKILPQWKHNVANAFGNLPKDLQYAAELGEAVRAEIGESIALTFVGHSKGGAEAKFAASLVAGSRGLAFNSPGLGKKAGEVAGDALKNHGEDIHTSRILELSIQGDSVSFMPGALKIPFSRWGLSHTTIGQKIAVDAGHSKTPEGTLDAIMDKTSDLDTDEVILTWGQFGLSGVKELAAAHTKYEQVFTGQRESEIISSSYTGSMTPISAAFTSDLQSVTFQVAPLVTGKVNEDIRQFTPLLEQRFSIADPSPYLKLIPAQFNGIVQEINRNEKTAEIESITIRIEAVRQPGRETTTLLGDQLASPRNDELVVGDKIIVSRQPNGRYQIQIREKGNAQQRGQPTTVASSESEKGQKQKSKQKRFSG